MRSIPRVILAFARGEKPRGFFGDEIALVGVQNRLIERHPAEGRTGFDDFVEAAVFAFAERDRFPRAQVVAHDFGEQLPAAADFRREPLADDVAQGVGQANAELLFFAERKKPRIRLIDWPASIVCRVLSTRWPVSAAISATSTVARSRISPTRMTFGAWRRARAQAVGIVVEIVSQFALVEGGLACRMNELDRIFQRDDVDRLGSR